MNSEQQVVFDFLQTPAHSNVSVLLTGPAGTGKTYLTKAFIQALREAGDLPFAITGSTGAAAVLIGGRTLHSFMGIGLAKAPVESLVRKMTVAQKRRLIRLHTLIIDEISMISAELLDVIDAVLQRVRERYEPFGGVRCIFIGDACQLPPVGGRYFFEANVWPKAAIRVFQLTTLVRQSGDTEFQEMLMRLRWGTLTDTDYQRLKQRQISTASSGPTSVGPDDVQPTRLYALNGSVDLENERAFHRLLMAGQPTQTYLTYYEDPLNHVGTMMKIRQYAHQARIPESVVLSVGAQVMITWNQPPETGIVNGTRGVVQQLTKDSVVLKGVRGNLFTISYMRLDVPEEGLARPVSNARETPCIRFLPIRLAYAVSIHKSQGITLDCAEMDLGESIFEYGQAYTALSRVKSLEALRLTGLSRRAFRTHPAVLYFYQGTTSEDKGAPSE